MLRRDLNAVRNLLGIHLHRTARLLLLVRSLRPRDGIGDFSHRIRINPAASGGYCTRRSILVEHGGLVHKTK